MANEDDRVLRGMGFYPVWVRETIIGGGYQAPDFYQCRRGCGGLVHDPAEHMKNVCPEFRAVVGG